MTILERFAIAEILHDIEICIDQRDVEGFAAHFAEDARYRGPFGEHHGRAAIREMSRAHHASGSMTGKRRMTGPARVTIEGERAQAYSHWWVAEIHDRPGVYSTGTYTDHLSRHDDRWVITDRAMTIDPSWYGEPPT